MCSTVICINGVCYIAAKYPNAVGVFLCVFFFNFTVILLLHVTAVRPVVELIIRGALYSRSVPII